MNGVGVGIEDDKQEEQEGVAPKDVLDARGKMEVMLMGRTMMIRHRHRHRRRHHRRIPKTKITITAMMMIVATIRTTLAMARAMGMKGMTMRERGSLSMHDTRDRKNRS